LKEILDNIKEQILNDENNYVKTNINEFVIEEYVAGVLFSVDGVIQNNKIFFIGETEFFLGKEPQFIQLGGITPTEFNYKQIVHAKKFVTNIIHTLQYNNCGFHCEMRMHNGTPVLIEIAARTPGGPLLNNYKVAYGIDGADLMFDVWIGKDINPIKMSNKYILHKDVFSKNNGVISNFDIPIEIIESPFLIELIPFVKLNDDVINTNFKSTTLYYYSTVGNTLNEVIKNSEYIESNVKINIL
jgi:predicted ATP-grasp superfamily ATP-dependent carboligase